MLELSSAFNVGVTYYFNLRVILNTVLTKIFLNQLLSYFDNYVYLTRIVLN